jgi:NAD(P)-dependent dehydrogenase (short-subunit alcohol dehydrogenase family)
MFDRTVMRGEVVLVTGASSGLGKHFAKVLAAHGASVAIAARRVDRLAEVANDIRRNGGIAFDVALDVMDPASVTSAIAAVEEALGPISVLVNNSGTTIQKSFLEQSEEDVAHVLDTNLGGALRVAQAVARRMVETKTEGRLVHIASILSFRVAGQLSAYSASKAALVSLSESMALELARYGIRSNAIAPGYFATEINDGFFDTDAGKTMLKRVPQRRLGRLEELDAPLLLLCSRASSFITGTTIRIDGGHTISSL